MYLKYNYTSTRYWSYRDSTKEGLTITSPVSVDQIKKQVPNVKAFCFEFHRTKFKKTKTDHAQYLAEIIAAFPTVHVEIMGSSQLEELPACLLDKAIDTFELRNCPNVKDFSILGDLKTLQEVRIVGTQYRLGSKFYELPKLIKLSLFAKEIEDIDQLPKLQHLRSLELSNLTVQQLPKGIEQFQQLKEVRFSKLTDLTIFPTIKNWKQLKTLWLYQLPALTTLPDDFADLESLEHLSLLSLGNKSEAFLLPDSIGTNNSLKELSIKDSPIAHLPNTFNNTSLKKLNLFGLAIQQLPDTIGQLHHLQELTIYNCPNLRQLNNAVVLLINLKVLRLDTLKEFVHFNCSFKDLVALEKLSLKKLPKVNVVPNFGDTNEALKEISIEHLLQLEQLPESLSKCQQLDNLSLTGLSITSLPITYNRLENLTNFCLFNMPELEYIPSPLVEMGKGYFTMANTPKLRDESFKIGEMIRFVRNKIPEKLRPIIAYWIFENLGKESLTKEIKQGTLAALSLSNPTLQRLLQHHLHHLNERSQKLGDAPISPNESVVILGTTQNQKRQLQNQLKEVGFSIKRKISPSVKYVLIGKNPKADDTFWDSPRLVFSEATFVAYHKKHRPRLFHQADVPQEYIKNLQKLIWSTDPNNELLALELVRNNGLPEVLIPDFLVAAKTGQDKKIREQIRRFLRGNLSTGAQRILSHPAILNTKRAPFASYSPNISNAAIAQMAVACYRRYGRGNDDFFRYDDGSSPFRQELFESMLPEWLKKPHYLYLPHNLTESEINTLLDHPVFQGKLERLVLGSELIQSIPTGVFKHTTIKDLTINASFVDTTLPTSIFDLYKLNKLNITWDSLQYLPDKFGQLNRLREVFIYSKNILSLPDSFKQLTKLKRAYLSGGLKEKRLWEEAMPTVAF